VSSPSRRLDLLAGLLTVAITVLAGAPVGLLWAAVGPHVDVVVDERGPVLREPGTDVFIAADGYFLAAVLLAGVVTGLVAWRLGRRHGPAVVPALAVGGLLAAFVAARVGGQVGLPEAQEALRSGQFGVIEVALRLRAWEAMLGWPVAALTAYLAVALLYEEHDRSW
jgi:MFS family permease